MLPQPYTPAGSPVFSYLIINHTPLGTCGLTAGMRGGLKAAVQRKCPRRFYLISFPSSMPHPHFLLLMELLCAQRTANKICAQLLLSLFVHIFNTHKTVLCVRFFRHYFQLGPVSYLGHNLL